MSRQPSRRGHRPATAAREPRPSGAVIDTAARAEEITTELLGAGASLHALTDPLLVETGAALFLGPGLLEPTVWAVFTKDVIPAVATAGTEDALAVVLATQHLAPDPALATAATEAAAELRGAGVADPVWAAELTAPLKVAKCWQVVGDAGQLVVLATIERAGTRHGIAVGIDRPHCGEANQITVIPPDALDEFVTSMPRSARRVIAPAEFRWLAESAVDIRFDHQVEGASPFDGRLLAMAVILRDRLTLMPEPTRPLRGHNDPFDL